MAAVKHGGPAASQLVAGRALQRFLVGHQGEGAESVACIASRGRACQLAKIPCTVVVEDDRGQEASDDDDAVVELGPAPGQEVSPRQIAVTGLNLLSGLGLAIALSVAGLAALKVASMRAADLHRPPRSGRA